MGALATVAAGLVVASPAQATALTYTVTGQRLNHGKCLSAGQAIVSYYSADYPTPKTVLVMQHDGNLVLYPRNDKNAITGKAYWSTRTSGKGNRVCFQTDSNLVLRSVKGTPLWNSHTAGIVSDWVQTSPRAKDPSVELIRVGAPDALGGASVWSSLSGPVGILTDGAVLGTGQTIWSANHQYRLTLEPTRAALRTAAGRLIWATPARAGVRFFGFTQDRAGVKDYLAVFSGARTPVTPWQTPVTTSSKVYVDHLQVRDTGRLAVYSTTGSLLWAS